MIKIYQDIEDPEYGKGNCLQAAVASLLELQLNEVPDFSTHMKWFSALAQFLRDHGHQVDGFVEHQNGLHQQMRDAIGVKGYFLGWVYSWAGLAQKRDWTHVVLVNKGLYVIHDVSPRNQHVLTYPKADELGCNGLLRVLRTKPV